MESRRQRRAQRRRPASPALLEALAFVAEVLVFSATGVGVFRAAGEGRDAVVLAVSAVVSVVVLWATLMAPRATHRLGPTGRAVTAGLVGALAAGLTVVGGGVRWPVATVAATLVLLAAALRDPRRGPSRAPVHVSRHARAR